MLTGQKLSNEEKWQALERVLNSQVFSRSESLCRFLEFVGRRNIEGDPGELKEYTIATEALGRSKDYDPSCDSVVRVQANRVRRKLEQYYAEQGADDAVRVHLPGGRYALTFAPRHSAKLRLRSWLEWGRQNALVFALSVACTLFLGLWLYSVASPGKPLRNGVTSELEAVWAPFLKGQNTAWIVYSNALFLMTEAGDLLRFHDDAKHRVSFGGRVEDLRSFERRAQPFALPSELYFADVYSGAGEVVGASLLGSLFTRFDRPFSVKRSRFVDFQDLQNRDVIFLGPPSEIAILRKCPRLGEFVFERMNGPSYLGQFQIRDRKSPTGEPHVYGFDRDPKSGAVTAEYAVVSVLEGLTRGRYLMVLAGLSTLGTQAAAEFMTSPAAVAELVGHLGSAGSRQIAIPQYYQVLLRLEVVDGTPLKARYVTHRLLDQPERPSRRSARSKDSKQSALPASSVVDSARATQ